MKKEKELNKIGIIILSVFAFVIMLVCGIIFICNVQDAYNNNTTGGGFFPPSFSVIYYYFWVVVISMFIACCLKAFFEKKVSIIALLLIAVLLPIGCYHLNYHTFRGPLKPLVSEGGIFYFLVIGDYNFDGMNDKEYHLRYDERINTGGYGAIDDKIKNVDYKVTGTGIGLSGCHSFYYPEKQILRVFVPRAESDRKVEIKEIVLTVNFYDAETAEKFHANLDGNVISEKDVTYELGVDRVVITLNQNACLNAQSGGSGIHNEVDFKYYFDE